VGYLLDVNSLLTLALMDDEFHERVAAWLARLWITHVPEIATCAITELRLCAWSRKLSDTAGQLCRRATSWFN